MAASALAGLAFGSNEVEETSRGAEEHHEETQAEERPAAEDNAEVESRAKSVGWRPRDQFRGDPSLWVDAQTYLRRADEVMPLLKTENRRLEGRLRETESAFEATKQELESLKESVEGLKQFRSEAVQHQNAQTKDQLIDAILAAREAGDTRREIELNAELSVLLSKPAAAAPAKEEPAKREAPKKVTDSPEFVAWKEANPWWTEDSVKRAVATELTRKLASEGRFNGLTQTEALDLVTRETNKYLGAKPVSNGSKVGATRSTGSGAGGSGGNGRSWEDLPAEAKKQAERQAAKYNLVGKGRAFETPEAWRKFYAGDYFSSGTPVEIIET